MQGIFSGAESVQIVMPSDGAPDAALAAISALLAREATELALELGAPVRLEPAEVDARPRLELRVEPGLAVPQLTRDRAGEVLVAAGADLDGAVEALRLLRTLRCTGRRHLEARAAESVDEAIRRLEREVDWTYPAFALRDLDGINLHVSTALTYEHDGHCIEGVGIPTDLHLDLPPEQTAWTLADLHR